MDNIVLRPSKYRYKLKYAIFDFDGTLVKPKNGRKFPKNKDDWQYLRPSVPDVIRKYAKRHNIIFVTDQSKEWKVDMIKDVIEDLKVKVIAIIAMKKESQKPNIELFKESLPNFKLKEAFYVGDAGGRKDDWSDRDIKFAENLGIPYHFPEDIFPLEKEKPIEQNIAINEKEVIIMVGYPGSGKTTLAHMHLEKAGYYIVDGDILKTASKMKKEADKYVNNKSIVFDSTAGTKEKRAEFIKYAQEHQLPCRCIWIQTPIDIAMERNKERGDKKIPDIVFYVYRKHFEEPTTDEGCHILRI